MAWFGLKSFVKHWLAQEDSLRIPVQDPKLRIIGATAHQLGEEIHVDVRAEAAGETREEPIRHFRRWQADIHNWYRDGKGIANLAVAESRLKSFFS